MTSSGPAWAWSTTDNDLPSTPSSTFSHLWQLTPWHSPRSKLATSAFPTPPPASQAPLQLIQNWGYLYGSMAVTIRLGPGRVSLEDLARAHEVQIGNEHRSTLADCTVLARIRYRCGDLETCSCPALAGPSLSARTRLGGPRSRHAPGWWAGLHPDPAQERPQAVLKPGSGLRQQGNRDPMVSAGRPPLGWAPSRAGN